MRLEIPLTILSLSLMGGNMFFPWAPAHEIIGVLLVAVWAVHVYAKSALVQGGISRAVQPVSYNADGRKLRNANLCGIPRNQRRDAFESCVCVPRD